MTTNNKMTIAGSKMFETYKKEYPSFREKIFLPKFIKPIIELDHLIYG